MDLKDFIRETLVGIASGIQEAKIETGDIWALVPGALHGKRVSETSYIEFDVAVTVTETTESQKDGKAGVKAEISVLGSKVSGELGGGIASTKHASAEHVSRVSFKVPVHMNAHFRGDPLFAQEAAYLKDRKAGGRS